MVNIRPKNHRLLIFFLLLPFALLSQVPKKVDKIKFIHADEIQRKPNLYNGNILYTGNVIFEHNNGRLKSDSVVIYLKENKLKAFSNVVFTMDDNQLTSHEIIYDEATQIATALGDVVLRNDEQTLYTEKLNYNRLENKAYYDSGGTIVTDDSTINSQIGIYDLTTSSNTFDGDVRITNKDYYIEGRNLKHYSNGDYMEFNEDTRIQSRKNPNQYIKTTKGKYYLNKKEAFLENRSSVYNDGTILTADNLYFNQNSGYGKGEGDVVIDNPEEGSFIKGGFGEFFQNKDSAYVTNHAYAVKIFEKDSFFLHADTLMSTKKLEKGLIRAFHKAKYFKSNLQGKADSIAFTENDGVMRFFRDPVIWSGYRQITGDTITVFSNVEAERLDSIIVQNNAFALSKTDSITTTQFHQLKSKKMLGIFVDEQLDWVQAEGNAQSLIYVEDKDKTKKDSPNPVELIGINRSDCGIIEADFEEREINVISCRIKATSKLYPPSKIPEEERKLPGFSWRVEERPNSWKDIFNE